MAQASNQTESIPAPTPAVAPVANASAVAPKKPAAKASAKKPVDKKPADKKPAAKAAATTPKASDKSAAKPVKKQPEKGAAKGAVNGAPAAAQPKPAKEKKIKMVRDSISIPKNEYAALDEMKLRAAKLGAPVKKTELIRAGIKALSQMADPAFRAALGAIPSLKTGRPAKSV